MKLEEAIAKAKILNDSLKELTDEYEGQGSFIAAGMAVSFKLVLDTILTALRPVSREQVEKYLTPLTDDLLMGVINELSAGMVVRAEDKAFIAQVYSYAFVGLMLDWIKDEMKQDPETLVNRFALVIQDDVSCALNRFRVDRGNSASNPAD